MAELLNCPFCGGGANYVKHSAGIRGTMAFDSWNAVACRSCGGTVGASDRRFRNKEDAATAWNRRAPSSPSIEREVSGEGGEKAAAWEVEVHYSKGKRTLRAGMKWRDGITGSIWEVIEPGGGRIYSPSGFGGTPTFWCKPVEKTEAAQPWLKDARADGCVSFCGDSIAAGLIDSACVTPCDGGKNG